MMLTMSPRDTTLLAWCVVGSIAAHVLLLTVLPGLQKTVEPPAPLVVELVKPPDVELPKPLPVEKKPPPPEPVMRAYFGGLPGQLGPVLATAGWGWHVETGLHALRLITTGVFDRFPRLKIVIGHMGENLPFSIARAEAVLGQVAGGLQRKVGEYFREHFYLTTSGYFTRPPFDCMLQVVGIDRILFSVDLPWCSFWPSSTSGWRLGFSINGIHPPVFSACVRLARLQIGRAHV